jgi:hypothetical protein
MVESRQRTGVKREEDIVRSRYQATTIEDLADGEDLECVIVIC